MEGLRKKGRVIIGVYVFARVQLCLHACERMQSLQISGLGKFLWR